MNEKYDSMEDTRKHQKDVAELIHQIEVKLFYRALNHDKSKLNSPEKEILDEFVPKLSDVEYGTDEYRFYTNQMKIMTEHHYKHNSHHAEHNENGIDGMNLIDIIEMLCDWKAAGKRNPGGDIIKSLNINKDRYKISDQLYNILLNTIKELKWNTNSNEQNVIV